MASARRRAIQLHAERAELLKVLSVSREQHASKKGFCGACAKEHPNLMQASCPLCRDEMFGKWAYTALLRINERGGARHFECTQRTPGDIGYIPWEGQWLRVEVVPNSPYVARQTSATLSSRLCTVFILDPFIPRTPNAQTVTIFGARVRVAKADKGRVFALESVDVRTEVIRG